jgi:putative methyltransferase (TIGR04325 family)
MNPASPKYKIGNLVLRHTPVRSLLCFLGRRGPGLVMLRRLSGLKSVYPNFEVARSACQRSKKSQHTEGWLVDDVFNRSLQTRSSDYPALYQLAQIAQIEPLRVFDFGGGTGQSFYQYNRLLRENTIEQWMIMDLPEVINQARKRAEGRSAAGLAFSSSLSDARGCNVFHAAGSLHYWEHSIEQLAAQTGVLPGHLIINRTPLRDKGPTFIAVQSGRGWAVPCKIWNFDELTVAFQNIGYRLVDRWLVVEKSFRLPLLPEYDTPYQGAYFVRQT